MRGHHLTVAVDGDAGAGGLFEELLQVFQVVAGDNDERAFFHRLADGRRLGRSVCARVGAVEQGHRFQVDFAHLQHHRQERLIVVGAGQGGQRFGKEGVDGGVALVEHAGVPGIGGHAAQSEEDERLHRADILIGGVPHALHVKRRPRKAQRGSAGTGVGHHRGQRRVVKIDIGDAGKKAPDKRLALVGAVRARGAGQIDERGSQFVLKPGRRSLLAAHSGHAPAADAAGRLLTLKTKHLLFHFHSSSLQWRALRSRALCKMFSFSVESSLASTHTAFLILRSGGRMGRLGSSA